MSDDTSPGGTTPEGSGPAGPAVGGSQSSPPPPPPAPTPPQYQQVPPPDTTSQIPVATAARTGPSLNLTAGMVFALAAIVCIVLAVFLEESPGEGLPKQNIWDVVGGLWSIAAIVAAVLTLLPSLRTVVSLDEKSAWTIAAGAAGFLVFWWVVFILPILSFNVSFLATLGVVAAVLAAWTSPGNTYKRVVDPMTAP